MSHILVIDDTRYNLDLLELLLIHAGHVVELAQSGQRALQMVEKNPPLLILLDIMMPQMDGYEVARHLKAAETTRDIPIIFISALDETFNKTRAFEMGAVDYITKPFQAEEVLARVKTHMQLALLQRQQRELFHRFTNREVVDNLLTHGFNLGGEYVEATALFCDIRSFTSIAETLSAVETIGLLNDYLAWVVEVIGREKGIITHLIGDGLLAIFGAPVPYEDHAARAVRAAENLLGRLEEFNASQTAAGRMTLQIGIGIASGQMVAGYLGSLTRATYTCIGDTVNIAGRLEDYTKEVNQPILLAESTRNALPEELATAVHEVGEVYLKGKSQPVRVFAFQTA